MLILKKGHQPGVYVPLRALFLVLTAIKILSMLHRSVVVMVPKIDENYVNFSLKSLM